MAKNFQFGFEIIGDAEKGTKALRKVKEEITRLDGEQKKAKTGADSWKNSNDQLSTGLDKVKGLVAGLVGAVGVGMMISKFKDVAVETDKLRGNLVTMTGSTEAAGLAFDSLNEFAKKTPFTLEQSVNAFVKLKALGLDPSERALMSYGNTASAMGKDMMQMIEAVADASTGEFERLKDFGIIAKQQGDNVSLTFQGVTTTIAKESGAIQEYLLAIGETKFGDAMSNQMERLPGLISNLEMSVDGLFRKMADAGGTTIFTDGLKLATSAVEGLTENMYLLEAAAVAVATAIAVRLTGAVALLGGGAGVFLIASASALNLVTSLESLSEMNARLRGEINSLSEAQLRNSIAEQKAHNESARWAIYRMETTSKGYAAEERAIQIQQNRLTEGEKLLDEYRQALSDLTDGVKESTEETEVATVATVGLTEAQQKAADELEKLRKKTREYKDGLAIQQAQITMTAREKAIFNALLKAGATATAEEREQIIRATTALFDHEQALRDTADANREAGKAAADNAREQEAAAKKAEDDWRATRNSLSDYFADIMQDGSNAWDGIAKSAERATYKMVGDLLASGLLELIGSIGGGREFSWGNVVSGAGTGGGLLGALAGGGSGGSGGGGGSGTGILGTIGSLYGSGGSGTGLLGTIGGMFGGGAATTGLTAAEYVAMMQGGTTAAGTTAVTTAGTTTAGGGFMGALQSIPAIGWVAAGIMNEFSARKNGARDEDDKDYAMDLLGGKVLEQDAHKGWLKGLMGSDQYGFGADMQIASNLMSLDFSNAFKQLGQSSLGKLLGVSGGTPSHNAGFLLQDVAGAKADQKFAIDPFASGLAPVGFNRRSTQDQSTEVIDVFRALDKTVVDLGLAAGLIVKANANTFSGLSETGFGSGLFVGSAGQDGKAGTSLEQQLDRYTKSLLSTLAGQLEGESLNSILSAGNTDAMLMKYAEVLNFTGATAGNQSTAQAQAEANNKAQVERDEAMKNYFEHMTMLANDLVNRNEAIAKRDGDNAAAYQQAAQIFAQGVSKANTTHPGRQVNR